MDSSVDPSGSLSITSSPSAGDPLKFPCNNGENSAVNYLAQSHGKNSHHLYIMAVIAPVCVLSFCLSICQMHLSLHPSVHSLFHLSIHQTTNIRKSQKNSPVLKIPVLDSSRSPALRGSSTLLDYLVIFS